MSPGSDRGAKVAWELGSFLFLLTLQRMGELRLSARNESRMRALGGREVESGQFPWLVLLHVLFPLSLAAEVMFAGSRPGRFWPVWLGVVLAAQALRLATMRTLGVRWSVHIWVVPDLPLVTGGPYRLFRHPNYLAVAAELPAAALLFGAWRTAAIFTVFNLAALRARIRAEERALGIGPGQSGLQMES